MAHTSWNISSCRKIIKVYWLRLSFLLCRLDLLVTQSVSVTQLLAWDSLWQVTESSRGPELLVCFLWWRHSSEKEKYLWRIFVEWEERTSSLDVNIQFLQTDLHTGPLVGRIDHDQENPSWWWYSIFSRASCLMFVSILIEKLDSDQLFTFHSVDPMSRGFVQLIVLVLISLVL